MNVKHLPAWIASAILVILCAACTGAGNSGGNSPFGGANKPGSSPGQAEFLLAAAESEHTSFQLDVFAPDIRSSLEQLAEIERAGNFSPGLGITESGLREMAGDYAGAAIAAYKEISWAYGFGIASESQVKDLLREVIALFENGSTETETRRNAGVRAARACMAFAREDWKEAEELLLTVLAPDEEPDSFIRWMLLVCSLELNKNGDDGRTTRSAYGAIRARYALFPEYWYRGARSLSGSDGGIAAVYAEQCVTLSPQGPFAASSRNILAEHFGISPHGKDIRVKAEIEHILRASVSMNDPTIANELFPLLALPDNPYTLFALGATRELASVPKFREFFIEEARKHSGRLGERLNYIVRS